MPSRKFLSKEDKESLVACSMPAGAEFVMGAELHPAVSPLVKSDVPMVGEYYADYSAPSREQLEAFDSELDDLFKHSTVVATTRE